MLYGDSSTASVDGNGTGAIICVSSVKADAFRLIFFEDDGPNRNMDFHECVVGDVGGDMDLTMGDFD